MNPLYSPSPLLMGRLCQKNNSIMYILLDVCCIVLITLWLCCKILLIIMLIILRIIMRIIRQ